MADKIYNVLFLCTGNSARSILAESLLNRDGAGRFRAYSAGSQPKGVVHPLARELLMRELYPTSTLRSKSWEEFAKPGAPALDFIITVCDNAAGEACPIWPGQPMSAHWGIPDPAAATGSDEQRRAAFKRAFQQLQRRVQLFVGLKTDALDRPMLQRRLDDIGRIDG
ncbi:MAG: arsenate reductase ArsC [Alphaproteobacteria bacterium]